MSNAKFVVGDVVRLKSGGPKMTISEMVAPELIDEVAADCGTAWFDNNSQLYRELFYFDELESVPVLSTEIE